MRTFTEVVGQMINALSKSSALKRKEGIAKLLVTIEEKYHDFLGKADEFRRQYAEYKRSIRIAKHAGDEAGMQDAARQAGNAQKNMKRYNSTARQYKLMQDLLVDFVAAIDFLIKEEQYKDIRKNVPRAESLYNKAVRGAYSEFAKSVKALTQTLREIAKRFGVDQAEYDDYVYTAEIEDEIGEELHEAQFGHVTDRQKEDEKGIIDEALAEDEDEKRIIDDDLSELAEVKPLEDDEVTEDKKNPGDKNDPHKA